jgi:hypothetical protein
MTDAKFEKLRIETKRQVQANVLKEIRSELIAKQLDIKSLETNLMELVMRKDAQLRDEIRLKDLQV